MCHLMASGSSSMSVTLLTGLPGSGKSKRLIELVNASLDEGRPVTDVRV